MQKSYKELNQGNLALDMESFRSPESCFAPAYTWNWVSPISREMIDQSLSDMRDAGIRCLYVLPFPLQFRPFRMRTNLKPYYLSEEYYELLRYTWERARDAGMSVWYYDEAGFPSGNLTGRIVAREPKTALRVLEVRRFSLDAGVTYRQCEDVISARLEEDNTRVAEGARYDRDVTILEYFAFTTFETLSGFSQTSVIEPETIPLFIEMAQEEHYQRLSDLMGGYAQIYFTDEPGTGPRPWPDGIDERFRARYGYDLHDHLHAILDDRKAAEPSDQQARVDYLSLVGELFREHYMLPLRSWCRERGMLFSGHLNHDDRVKGAALNGYGSFLQTLRLFDLPGIDVIWRQIASPDQVYRPDKNNPFFARLAGSAAHQNGTNLALSESFAIYGAGLTGDQMRHIINHQLARGVNLFNMMSVQSSRDRAAGLAMRPCFSPEYPGYEHLRAMNEYITRASRLMQSGKPAVEAALYMPARDFLADSDTEGAAMAAYEALGLRLEAEGIDFDLIDDQGILEATIEGGALCLGDAAYRRVFTPECRYMPDEVRAKLDQMPAYDPAPVVRASCPALRARKRILPDGGSVYFVYNEGASPVAAEIGFACGLPVAVLDLANGCAALPAHADVREYGEFTYVKASFESGESRAFLFSAEMTAGMDLSVKPSETWTIAQFELSKSASFEIDMAGIRRDTLAPDFVSVMLGGWADHFGEGFSGEAVYKASVDLGMKPDREAQFVLLLGRVEHSAKVLIDGKPVGYTSFAPMRVTFSGEALPESGRFTLEIEVANTASNYLTRFENMEKWPAYELAHYWPKTLEEERETSGGGLYGPVTLSMFMAGSGCG